MSSIEAQMILALAAIDEALDLPADGCNSTARTLNAIRELRASTLPDCRTCYYVTDAYRQDGPACPLVPVCTDGSQYEPRYGHEPLRLYQVDGA